MYKNKVHLFLRNRSKTPSRKSSKRSGVSTRKFSNINKLVRLVIHSHPDECCLVYNYFMFDILQATKAPTAVATPVTSEYLFCKVGVPSNWE